MMKQTWFVVTDAKGTVFGAHTEYMRATTQQSRLQNAAWPHYVAYYVEAVTRVRKPTVGATLR